MKSHNAIILQIIIALSLTTIYGYVGTMRSFKPIATKLSTATLQNTHELDPAIVQSVKPKFTLNELRKAIPEEAFQKSLPKSLYYMAFDYSMWGLAFAAIRALKESEIWTTLPFAAQAGASLLYWNVAGFFMWCIFVVGHDCGHGTFSNHKLLNNILGHITHGSILVPFFPWQLSHRRHHMFHNHIEKDYSYNWYTPDALKKPQEGVARHFHENKLLSFFLPFYGWFMYIFLGIRDGNHFIPFKNERLWKGTPKIEYIKCLISAAVVGLFGAANYYLFGQNLANMAFYYLAPLVMFGWWLVTVTYLQHHHEDSVVYDDSDWNFVDSAFETVDRKYGFGIDKLHHHITDGHVAHHLFYTLIPHYNLPVATKAIKSFLAKNGASDSYRFEKTYDFPFRVHRYLMDFGFKARRAHP